MTTAQKPTTAADAAKAPTATKGKAPKAAQQRTTKGRGTSKAATGAGKALTATQGAQQHARGTTPAAKAPTPAATRANGKAQAARQGGMPAPGTKAAAVLALVLRPDGAVTSEIRAAATPLIRQTLRGLRKQVPGFSFESARIPDGGGEFRWKGEIA